MSIAASVPISYSNRIPHPPKVVKGRENVVSCIAENLTSGDPDRTRVCILAPGGMGKTSTSLAVMRHPLVSAAFSSHRQVWIPCIGLNSPSSFLTRLANALHIKVKVDALPLIKSVLEQPDEPYILLIDNFETTWYSTEGPEVSDILTELDSISELAIPNAIRLPPDGPLDLDQVTAARSPELT
jgi:Cdc6-like AAA superfamily ATPase